jgi:hypothetical protein
MLVPCDAPIGGRIDVARCSRQSPIRSEALRVFRGPIHGYIGSQSLQFSAVGAPFLWQIRYFRDNMQRFAIFTMLLLVCVLVLSRLERTSQAQPDKPQSVPADGAPAADAPAETPKPQEPPPDPEVAAAAARLLRDARDRLYAHESVKANLVERSTLGNRRFSAEGRYVSGRFPRLRLEYKVQVGDSEGILIEVCDGQVVRTSKEIRRAREPGSTAPPAKPTEIQVTRKEVEKILRATETGDVPPEAVLQAELGLGGIPTLLASLERTMQFDARRQETYQDRPYLVIQGHWKEEYLQKLGKQLGQSAQMFTPFMPEQVRIYFDEETLFPMRILYLKQATVEPKTFRAVLSLEFTDVELDQPIDPQEFRYVPPRDVPEVDETAVYLKSIEHLRAAADAAAADASSPEATPPGPAQ